MSRSRLFTENFIIYGFSRIVGKIIPLMMLPIITRLIPDTTIYGIFDILNVIISISTAVAVFGMYDSMFRLFFDKDDVLYQKKVCFNALSVTTTGAFLIGFIVVIFSKEISFFFYNTVDYYKWLIICGVQIFSGAVGQIIIAPTRMQNKRKIFLIMSIVTPTISYATSIPIIIYIDPLLGLIGGAFLSNTITVVIFWFMNKKWFFHFSIDKRILQDLFKIGIPIVPTYLMYWIFTSFDRMMITNMLGPSYNGIYAAGAKFAFISKLISAAYLGGWSYFNYTIMNDHDYKHILARIWRLLFFAIACSFCLFFPFMKSLYQVLFAGDYRQGYIVFPYLYLAPLFLLLYQNTSTVYVVHKKTIWSPIFLSIGVITNIILNFILIPKFGIEGAAIATLTGYIITLLFAIIVTVQKKYILPNIRGVISLLLFILLFITLRVVDQSIVFNLVICLAFVGFLVIILKDDIRFVLKKVSSIVKKSGIRNDQKT